MKSRSTDKILKIKKINPLFHSKLMGTSILGKVKYVDI